MVTVTLPLWVVVVVLAFGLALIAMQGWRILLLVQGNAQRRELAAFARHWESLAALARRLRGGSATRVQRYFFWLPAAACLLAA